MTWLKLTEKAIYLMDGAQYIEKEDFTPSTTNATELILNVPQEWFDASSPPGTLVMNTDPNDTEPLPKPRPTVSKVKFEMALGNSGNLREGRLEILDSSGNSIFEAIATSGLPSNQGIDDIWVRNYGPIPPQGSLRANSPPIEVSTLTVYSDTLGIEENARNKAASN